MISTQKKSENDPAHGVCPISSVVKLLGDSWSLLIIRDLLVSPKRFGDLESSLTGISTRTLSSKLKNLECNGFIERRVLRSRPLRVEYVLTERGRELSGIVEAVRVFGKKHLSS